MRFLGKFAANTSYQVVANSYFLELHGLSARATLWRPITFGLWQIPIHNASARNVNTPTHPIAPPCKRAMIIQAPSKVASSSYMQKQAIRPIKSTGCSGQGPPSLKLKCSNMQQTNEDKVGWLDAIICQSLLHVLSYARNFPVAKSPPKAAFKEQPVPQHGVSQNHDRARQVAEQKCVAQDGKGQGQTSRCLEGLCRQKSRVS